MSRPLPRPVVRRALTAVQLLALVALPTFAQETPRSEGYALPTLALDMLVFDSGDHLAEGKDELLIERQLEDLADDREGDDRTVPRWQGFANSLEFESLVIVGEAARQPLVPRRARSTMLLGRWRSPDEGPAKGRH